MMLDDLKEKTKELQMMHVTRDFQVRVLGGRNGGLGFAGQRSNISRLSIDTWTYSHPLCLFVTPFSSCDSQSVFGDGKDKKGQEKAANEAASLEALAKQREALHGKLVQDKQKKLRRVTRNIEEKRAQVTVMSDYYLWPSCT